MSIQVVILIVAVLAIAAFWTLAVATLRVVRIWVEIERACADSSIRVQRERQEASDFLLGAIERSIPVIVQWMTGIAGVPETDTRAESDGGPGAPSGPEGDAAGVVS